MTGTIDVVGEVRSELMGTRSKALAVVALVVLAGVLAS